MWSLHCLLLVIDTLCPLCKPGEKSPLQDLKGRFRAIRWEVLEGGIEYLRCSVAGNATQNLASQISM